MQGNGSEAPFVSGACQNASKCVIRAVHKTGSWVPLLHAICKQIVTSEAVGVLSTHKESHGSHGNFYEGEQEQCCSIPVGALYGGLRISHWNKLCWSRAGVILPGTTGQPRRSRSFPGYCTSRFDFMIRIPEGELFFIPLKLHCSVQ